jgi:hypothetical protein
MARKLEVEIIGDSSSLSRAFKDAGGSAAGFGSTLGRVAKGAALAVGAAGIGGLAIALKVGISEWKESTLVAAQTGAVLKSTGGIANVTAKDVAGLSDALMRKSGVDDEAIASGQNMLLTFTKIRNEVGAGNDVFNQATKATLDMSVAMGKDMPAAAILVGKALNDPVKGVSALTKAGIQFTEAQKESIKAMVESGDVMGAQKLILKELETQFGGSAEAAGKTLPGQLRILRESFNNLAGDIVGKAMPAVANFVRDLAAAKGFQAKVEVVIGAVKDLAVKAGEIAVALAGAISEKLATTDWAAVGAKVGAAISTAITVTTEFMDKALGATLAWITANAGEIGRVGALIGLTMLATMTDPGFWMEHWQLALVIFGTVIAGSAARLAPAVIRLANQVVDDLVFAIAFGAPRVGGAFLTLVETAVAVLRTLGPKIGAVIALAMVTLVRGVIEAVGEVGPAAVRVGLAIVDGFRSGLRTLISAVAEKLAAVKSAVMAAAGDAVRAAVALGMGIVSGILAGLAGLAGQVGQMIAGSVRSAIDFAKRNVGSTAEEYAAAQLGAPLALGVVRGFDAAMSTGRNDIARTVSGTADWVRTKSEGDWQRVGIGLAESIVTGFERGMGALGDRLTNAILAPIIMAIDRAIARAAGISGKWEKPGGIGWRFPGLAAGGIVTSPTLAMVGERGPEAIIPLGRGGMGGDVNVTVNVPGGYIGSEEKLAEIVANRLGRQMQQGRVNWTTLPGAAF